MMAATQILKHTPLPKKLNQVVELQEVNGHLLSSLIEDILVIYIMLMFNNTFRTYQALSLRILS
jgi:hypothetical protein